MNPGPRTSISSVARAHKPSSSITSARPVNATKGDHRRTAGGCAGDFNGVFDSCGPGGHKEIDFGAASWSASLAPPEDDDG
ncbi:hypothetical protein [Epibacterium ulvae]|uniref:hypothetical protein n=1 Tax=Epibacterium ulvae TaxID=1156985 RepID=UPI000C2232A9|nr:hypothetical protein [Epibacterium ulvae]